jgi:hypothetical protein
LCWSTPDIPATVGSINRRIIVQAGLGKKQDSISKITRAKRAGCVAQVVEQSLDFKPQYHQKKVESLIQYLGQVFYLGRFQRKGIDISMCFVKRPLTLCYKTLLRASCPDIPFLGIT